MSTRPTTPPPPPVAREDIRRAGGEGFSIEEMIFPVNIRGDEPEDLPEEEE